MRSIEVPTPNGLTLRCERASIGRRLAAFAVDASIFAAIAVALYLLPGAGGFQSSTGGQLWTRAPFFETLSAFLLAAAFVLLPALQLYNRGGTTGKKWFDLRVIRANGETPSFWDCLVRELLKPLDIIPPFCLLHFMGPGERLGDLASGTRVVHIAAVRDDEEVKDA